MAGDSTEDEFRLHKALIGGSMDDIRELLTDPKHFHLPNDNGLYPIHLAVQRDKNDVIGVLDLLLENGADFNSKTVAEGDTALHITLRLTSLDQCEEIILKLLSKGADPDIRNRKLRSAYDIAVNHGYYALLDVLSGEISPESFEKDRRSSRKTAESKYLIAAILDGDLEKIKEIAPNADVNYVNEFGEAAVHYLIAKAPPSLPKPDVLEILMSEGSDVNIINHDKDTPLHLILKKSQYPSEMIDLVHICVKNGADTSMKDKDGSDVVQLAENKGYSDVVKIFKPVKDEKKEEEEEEDTVSKSNEEDRVNSAEENEEVPWGK